MTHFFGGASGVALMVAIVVVIVVLTARLRMPYTVGLVIAGLAIGLLPYHPAIELTPSLVLFVFLPPLLFDGGWSADPREMARNWAPIGLLATVGVVAGIAITFVVLSFGAHLPAQTALIFGAIIAATDPVAILALFKTLRINPSLLSIVEGESLFNDGTATVAFSALLVTFARAGAGLNLGEAFVQFGLMTGGGILIGIGAGVAGRLAVRFVADQQLFVIFVTVVLAYGSYFIADDLHVSGIMAVIAAAMVVAGSRSLGRLSSDDRAKTGNFWGAIAFLASTLLFLLVGASVKIGDIFAQWPYAFAGIAAVVIGRPITVSALAPVSALLGRPLSRRWQNAITLAGMRGALSVALVLSLPHDYPSRELLVAMVFAVVLFTVVVQGTLLEPLLRAMGLIETTDSQHGSTPASTAPLTIQ